MQPAALQAWMFSLTRAIRQAALLFVCSNILILCSFYVLQWTRIVIVSKLCHIFFGGSFLALRYQFSVSLESISCIGKSVVVHSWKHCQTWCVKRQCMNMWVHVLGTPMQQGRPGRMSCSESQLSGARQCLWTTRHMKNLNLAVAFDWPADRISKGEATTGRKEEATSTIDHHVYALARENSYLRKVQKSE